VDHANHRDLLQYADYLQLHSLKKTCLSVILHKKFYATSEANHGYEGEGKYAEEGGGEEELLLADVEKRRGGDGTLSELKVSNNEKVRNQIPQPLDHDDKKDKTTATSTRNNSSASQPNYDYQCGMSTNMTCQSNLATNDSKQNNTDQSMNTEEGQQDEGNNNTHNVMNHDADTAGDEEEVIKTNEIINKMLTEFCSNRQHIYIVDWLQAKAN
jgi:hypothetical protein